MQRTLDVTRSAVQSGLRRVCQSGCWASLWRCAAHCFSRLHPDRPLIDTIREVKRLPITTVLLLILAAAVQSALAHATLVFGELTTDPAVVTAGEPFVLQLHMMDPVRTPIEDAEVWAEFRPMSAAEASERLQAAPELPPTPEQVEAGEVEVDIGAGDWQVVLLQETGPGGNYAGPVTLPEPGSYQVIMRDTTYPQEDALAELLLEFDGSSEFGAQLFIFPPTDIGGASLMTWLIWLVAIPLVAGVIVTVSVLKGKPSAKN